MKKVISKFFGIVTTIICIAAISVIGIVALDSSTALKWSSAEAVEVTAYGSPNKYYYHKLENIEKHAYNEIISHIYELPETIEVPAINAEQLDRIFSALLYDNPDLFFVGRKCTLSSSGLKTFCSVEYIMSPEEYTSQKEELTEIAEKVIAGLTSPDDAWQTELEIHDYIIENCRYELSEPKLVCSSSYGALVNGYAACEGYSKAAKLLLDMAGIECAVVSGVSENFNGNEGAHMWNAVKIDGEFYYLDCTWDDPVNDEKKDVKLYSYFNLNNEMISVTHSDFSYDFECTATAANYYVKTGSYFENYSRTDEKAVVELIAKNLNSGLREVQLKFANRDAYDKAVEDLIDGERIYSILSRADDLTEESISYKTISYYKDSEQLILTLVPAKG